MCFVCRRTEADIPQGQPCSHSARAEVGREEKKEGEMLGGEERAMVGGLLERGSTARKAVH